MNNIFIQLVKAGEASGKLDVILDRLTDYLEKREAINKKVGSALRTPLMNLALMAANLLSKQMNHIWVVPREMRNAAGQIIVAANYDYLGYLLIITIIVGLVVPVLAVLLFLRRDLS